LEEDSELIWKSLPLAQQKLSTAEDRYKKGNFTNVREEKLQVNEINRIKRNIAKLAKYLPLVEEKKALEVEIGESRQEIRVIRNKMRSYRDQINDCKKHIRDCKTPFTNMRRQCYELDEEKRRIIQNYEQKRQKYLLWAQQNVSHFNNFGL
jgi:uncharacterized coiled-coil DUF342 family protein